MPRLTRSLKILLCFSITLASFSCAQGKLDPFDRPTGASVSDVRNLITKDRAKEKKEIAENLAKEKSNPAPIPQISKLIMSPPPPAIGGDKIISFSVTDQVPLKDVLIELGRVAKIDVDLDTKISGGVIINAKNRPLKEVIDRIATQGNLRYSYKNGVLYFESDSAYTKNYFVDYLSEGNVWSDVETNIGALLSLDEESSSSEEREETSSSSSGNSSFSSNKSAGIITIHAPGKQHKAIEEYLELIQKYASAQVLIEAKVVEVSLIDEFKTGINWNNIAKNNQITSTGGFAAGSPITYLAQGVFGADINASISALESFGSTRTISSPRIHAMNNQKASLNFADKLVYFQVTNTQSTQAASGAAVAANVVTTSNSVKQEESVGISLAITPSINLKTREIVMQITPKIALSSKTVVDPVNSSNEIPVVQSRELNTTAKIQDGNVIVIGGLMKEETTNADQGIPYLNRIPVLGWLFKSVSKKSTIIETVIFVKATIVTSSGASGKVDRDLQQKLDPNKRRFF